MQTVWVVMGVQDNYIVILYAGTDEDTARSQRSKFDQEREERKLQAVLLMQQVE